MKRQFSFLWVAFALFAAFPACGPAIQSTHTPGSALVTVECQNVSQRQVVELLRSGRGKDVAVAVADGFSVRITAAFSPMETPAWKLAQVLQDLHGLSGVIHVDVEENPRPIRQNF